MSSIHHPGRKVGLLKGLAGALALCVGLSTTSEASEPLHGGVLRTIVTPEPPTLMLGLNQQSPTQLVAGKIYESLLRWTPDLKPIPCLAKSWTISEDGKVYTFELQSDVKWQDGEPFTADDVVFSIDKFLRSEHNSTGFAKP